jgi:hypothetical protein
VGENQQPECDPAAQVTAELNIHIENLVSIKAVRRELHKSNITLGLVLR